MMLGLPLVRSLQPKVQADCIGLENGDAPILEKVSPVTADLLRDRRGLAVGGRRQRPWRDFGSDPA